MSTMISMTPKKVRFNLFSFDEDHSCHIPPAINMLFVPDGDDQTYYCNRQLATDAEVRIGSCSSPNNDENKTALLSSSTNGSSTLDDPTRTKRPKKSRVLVSKKRQEYADLRSSKKARCMKRVLFLEPLPTSGDMRTPPRAMKSQGDNHHHRRSGDSRSSSKENQTMSFFLPPVPPPPKRSTFSSLNSNTVVSGGRYYNITKNKKRTMSNATSMDIENSSPPPCSFSYGGDACRDKMTAGGSTTNEKNTGFHIFRSKHPRFSDTSMTTPSPKKRRLGQSMSPPPLVRPRRASRPATLSGIISRMVS